MAAAVGAVAYAIQREYGLALRSAMGILGPVGKAFGVGIRAIKLGIKVARKRFSAPKRGKADFIVSRDGAVISNSPAAARQYLENAGFGGKKISNPSGTETGTIHNIREMKMDVRVMNGGPVHPSRFVTTRQGTRNQLIRPTV